MEERIIAHAWLVGAIVIAESGRPVATLFMFAIGTVFLVLGWFCQRRARP